MNTKKRNKYNAGKSEGFLGIQACVLVLLKHLHILIVLCLHFILILFFIFTFLLIVFSLVYLNVYVLGLIGFRTFAFLVRTVMERELSSL